VWIDIVQTAVLSLTLVAIFLQYLALRRTIEVHLRTTLRTLHLSLLEIAMRHPTLASVWPLHDFQLSPDIKDPTEALHRHLYANLILSHQELSFFLGPSSEEDMRRSLEHVLSSPAIREYWQSAKLLHSKRIDKHSRKFHELVEDVCQKLSARTVGGTTGVKG